MSGSISREQAADLLAASESEIRALGVARLTLFGSVLRGDARLLTATLTSSCSSPLAPRRSIAFLRLPSFLRNFSAIEWNSLRLRRFLRSLGRESWQKRKMSSEPREYRRHILMEANYFISQRTGLTFEDFAADETLRRAVVRSFEIMPPQQNLWVDSGSGSRPRV